MMKKNFNKKTIILIIMLFLSLFLSACKTNNNDNSITPNINIDDVINEEDIDTNISNNAKDIDDYTITKGGEYIIKGSINNTIIVNAPKEEVTLVLENTNISVDAFACIYILKSSKVYINLVGENVIKSESDFVQIDDNNVDGAIFSKCDLTIKGDGTLNINSSCHGIVCKDNLIITANNIEINANKKGIDANDSIVLNNTNITIDSKTDGIHVENEDETLGYLCINASILNITSSRDALSSSSILDITSSTIDIITTSSDSIDTYSFKGIKSAKDIVISDAICTINTKDDAIHSNANITINSGTFNITSNDDGIHADNSLVINGGNINILKSYEGLEGKNVTINDGTINIISTDDGINASGGNDGSSFNRPGANRFASSTSSDVYININGGNITIDSSGDGIDSNANINVTGGNTLVYGPTSNGDSALDYDGQASITGGTICAIGTSGMAQNFSSSTQGSILYNISSSQSKNATICLKDSSGNIIYEVESKKNFNSILISTPQIVKGSYVLIINTLSYNITLNDLIYSNNRSTQGGGFRH